MKNSLSALLVLSLNICGFFRGGVIDKTASSECINMSKGRPLELGEEAQRTFLSCLRMNLLQTTFLDVVMGWNDLEGRILQASQKESLGLLFFSSLIDQ